MLEQISKLASCVTLSFRFSLFSSNAKAHPSYAFLGLIQILGSNASNLTTGQVMHLVVSVVKVVLVVGPNRGR